MAINFYWWKLASPGVWFFVVLAILAFIFLIVGAWDLKKDERQFGSVKLLGIMGIILLTWRIVTQIIPDISFSMTYPDMSIALIYFLTIRLLGFTFFLMLGIAFLMFGSKNREQNGALMRAAGILIIIGVTYNMVFYILYLLDWLANMPLFDLPYVLFLSSIWVEAILVYIAVTLFLVYTIIIKKVFLIISAALLVTLYTFNILDLIGILAYIF